MLITTGGRESHNNLQRLQPSGGCCDEIDCPYGTESEPLMGRVDERGCRLGRPQAEHRRTREGRSFLLWIGLVGLFGVYCSCLPAIGRKIRESWGGTCVGRRRSLVSAAAGTGGARYASELGRPRSSPSPATAHWPLVRWWLGGRLGKARDPQKEPRSQGATWR